MQDDFEAMFAYNRWATDRVASKLKRLGVEQPATDFVLFALEQVQPKA